MVFWNRIVSISFRPLATVVDARLRIGEMFFRIAPERMAVVPWQKVISECDSISDEEGASMPSRDSVNSSSLASSYQALSFHISKLVLDQWRSPQVLKHQRQGSSNGHGPPRLVTRFPRKQCQKGGHRKSVARKALQ